VRVGDGVREHDVSSFLACWPVVFCLVLEYTYFIKYVYF
jgi:hypothetical protein